ncbi:MAG: M48 family metallopeptidase [Cyclobacteriaceae bacterium]|nr:M48 family metallopeptidase [Cyclobacteriaceae bacterium]
MKLFLKFLLLVALFFASWFVLRQVDWVTLLKVKQMTRTTEEKLGNLFWEMLDQTEDIDHSQEVAGTIDSLLTHLCKANAIDREKIKLHVVDKDMVNAFTLPDAHLVILTGLVNESENEAELLGVIAHELAHVEKNHVMKKLVKEIGLSVLISMTQGGSGETVRQAMQLLTSSAYDRELEREADLTAVDFLIKAEVDPEPFANFLYRLSENEEHIPRQVFWITTHPDSKERAENIINYMKGRDIHKKSILTPEEWGKLKEKTASED